ncbi:MAG: alpha/beta hydrolase-fold protein [Planctomycetota bacterium]
MNALLSCLSAAVLATVGAGQSPAERIDRYLDRKAEGTRAETEGLLAALGRDGHAGPAAIEALLRAPRSSYPDASALLGKTTVHDVSCYHVDHTAKYRLFVPKDYRDDRPTPLVLVAHGGNSSMSAARAARTAQSYLRAYAPTLSRELGAIVVAPDTTRGWGQIGNSLALSTISDLKRRLNIDPDRVYVTGQSMGGHMAFRAALAIGDRFAAVSPQSGGYDFVAKGSIGNLSNVPGYVTWGKREPYGIDKDSRTNAAWAKQHGLDWVFVEKPGGHEIYGDELPKVAAFFAARPRNLYRERIYARLGGAMKFVKPWAIKGWPQHTVHHETRPLRWNQQHWLELTPRPDHEGPLLVLAANVGDNRFEITSENVRELHVHLHPRMVDFDEPVTIAVNGEVRFEGRVEPDPVHLLEHARAFDDRGKAFWARVRVTVETDGEVAFPERW